MKRGDGMSRVVVIGATGHIGTYLVPRLVDGGHQVTAVSRDTRGPYHASPQRDAVTTVTADREAEDAAGTFGDRMPPAVHREIRDALRARLVDLVRAGTDVVLDLSFWSRAMREEYRALLRPLGVVPETVYLATDRATVLKRVSARAARDGDDFGLSPELAAAYFDHFEPPTDAEGPLTVIG